MAEKEIENVIRNLIDSLEKKDMNRALSFFTDDATWFATQGTFKGRDEIKRYLAYLGNLDFKFIYEGVGIIVQENKAASQSIYEATYKGTTIKVSNICTYEFSGDRIKYHWAMMDRLSMAKQFSTGPIAKKIVNSIIARTEMGLH